MEIKVEQFNRMFNDLVCSNEFSLTLLFDNKQIINILEFSKYLYSSSLF